MKQLTHNFFGELDLEKGLNDDTIVLWKEEVNGINTKLWYVKDTEISIEILDKFSQFLNNFEEYHQKSLKALEDCLTEDDEYIVFHREEVELDVPKEASKFVQSMHITNIGLWVGEKVSIIVDYMIDPEESNQILAVKFDKNLGIVDIAWES